MKSLKVRIENIISIIIKSEHIHDFTLMTLLSIVVWRNSFNIYGEAITSVLILLVLIEYHFMRLIIQKDKRLAFKCWILCSVISFLEVLGKMIRPYLYQNIKLNIMSILNVLILGMILAIIITPIVFYMIDSIKKVSLKDSKISSKAYIIRVWIVTELILGIYWLGYYPGLLAYSTQWEQNISSNNSLMYSIVAYICLGIGRLVHKETFAILLLNLIQTNMIGLSLGLSLNYLRKLGINKFIRVGILVFYLVLPVFPIMSICSSKCALLGAVNLLSIVYIYKSIREKSIEYEKIGIIIIINGLIEVNYLYVALLFGIILFIKYRDNKKFRNKILKLEGSLLIIVCILLGLNRLTGVDNRIYDKIISIPCQQIARTCSYNRVEDLENLKTIDLVMPLVYCSEYNVLNPDIIKNTIDTEKLAENRLGFFKEYIGLGLKYPKEYIEAYLLKNIGIWYSNESTTYNTSSMNMSYYSIEDRNIVIKVLNKGLKMISYDKLSDHIGIFNKLFYTGLYVWLNIISLFGMIWKNKKEYIAIPLIMLGYLFVLSFDTYINIENTFNILMCTPFILCLAIASFSDKEIIKEK